MAQAHGASADELFARHRPVPSQSQCGDAIGDPLSKEKCGLPYHPCFDDAAHSQVARLHLPVAFQCNTRCGYCERVVSVEGAGVCAPGLSETLLSPMLAAAKARLFVRRWGPQSVVGVAGPGEPLANEETISSLTLIRRDFPDISLCVCTNGLNLPDRLDELVGLNVQFLTITINGIDPSVVAQIQPEIRFRGGIVTGVEAAQALIERQLLGLERAVRAGLWVKVNCVVIPEINGDHVVETAFTAARLGAHVFNPIPLIPRARFAHLTPPDGVYMVGLRSECARALPVFHQCKRCRADAEGIPGKECSG